MFDETEKKKPDLYEYCVIREAFIPIVTLKLVRFMMILNMYVFRVGFGVRRSRLLAVYKNVTRQDLKHVRDGIKSFRKNEKLNGTQPMNWFRGFVNYHVFAFGFIHVIGLDSSRRFGFVTGPIFKGRRIHGHGLCTYRMTNPRP